MGGARTLILFSAALVPPLVGAAAAAAFADGGAAPPPVVPAPAAEGRYPASDTWPFPPGQPQAASEAVRLGSTPVHGDLTLRYRIRSTSDETDQDFYQYLAVRVGEEATDRVSANFLVRVVEDLDRGRRDHAGYTFDSLADTFDSRVNTLLYTAYVNLRPEGGKLEQIRIGRQYVYAAETFQFDGAWAQTRPLGSTKLRFSGYAGVPVHYYEGSSSGDWLAGAQASAEPWKGGRAALDYTHVQDELSILGAQRNDLAAISLWQNVAANTELYGQYSWLEGPRDATLRATWGLPDKDLLVQASYYRLLEDRRRYATEFDPFFSVLVDEVRYQQGDLRASKGLGEHFDVEVGGMARQLLPGEDTGRFNRDTRRLYVTPTMTDIPWKGTSISVTAESLTGDGERLQTWALDVSHRFSKSLKVSAGSDYSLYAFGPLGADERSHVRTAYARLKTSLSASVSADVQYTWEKDDVETFHVLTLALVLDF